MLKLWQAFGYSLAGLKSAFQSEFAIKLEVVFMVILTPLIIMLDFTMLQKAILIFAMLVVFMAELVNTAIEALANTITRDIHPGIKKAKDIGSAVVFVALVNFVMLSGLFLNAAYY